MKKTPHELITDIGILIYGRDDFKADMIRDLGISRNTLAAYMTASDLSDKAKRTLRGLCALKAREKETHAKLLLEMSDRF